MSCRPPSGTRGDRRRTRAVSGHCRGCSLQGFKGHMSPTVCCFHLAPAALPGGALLGSALRPDSTAPPSGTYLP